MGEGGGLNKEGWGETDVSVYYGSLQHGVTYGSLRHGVQIVESRGHVTRHLEPALWRECGVIWEVCLQGTMTHERVDEAEFGPIATVRQDGEKTLVGQSAGNNGKTGSYGCHQRGLSEHSHSRFV